MPGLTYTGSNPYTFTVTGDASIFLPFSTVSYSIGYDYNGGSGSNPTSYNVLSTFTLSNPTQAYSDFVGWGGTGLSGNNNTSVTIPRGSTGNRSYTAYFWPSNNISISASNNTVTISTPGIPTGWTLQYSYDNANWYNASNPQTLTPSSSCTVYARYVLGSAEASKVSYNFVYVPAWSNGDSVNVSCSTVGYEFSNSSSIDLPAGATVTWITNGGGAGGFSGTGYCSYTGSGTGTLTGAVNGTYYTYTTTSAGTFTIYAKASGKGAYMNGGGWGQSTSVTSITYN